MREYRLGKYRTMKTFRLLFLLSSFHISRSARILGVFSAPARSHHVLGTALMKGLAERGHDVTIISAFSEKSLPKNCSYREIELPEVAEASERMRSGRSLFDVGEINPFLLLPLLAYVSYQTNVETLEHPRVQALLKSQEKFDLVIVEQSLNEAQKGFANHFGAPLVVVTTVGANSWINTLVGNPAPPSYVPDILLSYSSRMSLWERTVNSCMRLLQNVLMQYIVYPLEKKLYDKTFPDGSDFYDTMYNISLVLLNSHPSTNQPVPVVPNMIDIGGYHVQPSGKLPEDLQQFLDDAKEGVIYFSFGSNIRSTELPLEKRDAFLKTFATLKEKVLWKWEEDVLPGQPENVKVAKWLPQQEILAHPNVKLFITHGGLLSTTETIYHGVPVLAVPIGVDQKLNAKKITNEGFGLVLNYQEISERTLTEKLHELLTDPRYRQNAQKRSEIFHDRPNKPMDTAVYWIEYVIRHRGAPHLKVGGVDLPWYQYLLLDVMALVSVVLLFGVYVFYKVVRFSLRLRSQPKGPKLKRS